MRQLTILGATGSIGQSTLSVVRQHRERFAIYGLSAYNRVEPMVALCLEFDPKIAVMADSGAAEALAQRLQQLGCETRVEAGEAGLAQIACAESVDDVMAAIVGAAGLKATLAAIRAGKRLLLANKESLVMAGELFMAELQQHGAKLLPIDSEHNAIYQSLPANFGGELAAVGVERVVLTASGGPFRQRSAAEMVDITPEEAIAHPNWRMGQKISVDSATMMNKGLEVIEAHWLFNASAEQIEVVIHPQSVIHSMVAYSDGSVLAQLGNPDMRTPIAHALGYPERICSGVAPLDLAKIGHFEFYRPDFERFPALRLAYEALRAGGTAATVLNAANEVAVAAFLEGRIGFTDIPRQVEQALTAHTVAAVESIEQLLQLDSDIRSEVWGQIAYA
ncbi:1-deoxy-D-xylulose-5-phosphate reductoisomerase [Ectothiorhodospiraceae bacterium BW-2]|nr:1-deoxy-D-xylulose-5-phosphate reductoisomerase [Ectothiorhodospiraceae bacterium BW-2]